MRGVKKSAPAKSAAPKIRIVHLPSSSAFDRALGAIACGSDPAVMLSRGHEIAKVGERVDRLDVCLTCEHFSPGARQADGSSMVAP